MSDLVKITVNLTPAAYAALEDAATFEGDSKTDTINRAIQFYCAFVAERRVGHRVWSGHRKLTASEVTWS